MKKSIDLLRKTEYKGARTPKNGVNAKGSKTMNDTYTFDEHTTMHNMMVTALSVWKTRLSELEAANIRSEADYMRRCIEDAEAVLAKHCKNWFKQA